MYCDYWSLSEPPFRSDGSLAAFVGVPEAEDALLKLRYIVQEGKAGGVLVGRSGVGKTLLVRRLAAQLCESDDESQRAEVIRVPFPRLSPPELVADIAVRLGGDPVVCDSTRVGLDRLLEALRQELFACNTQQRPPVLVIEEAHTIDDPAVWRTLRLLMNLAEEPGSHFTLLLVGQNELLGRLREVPELDQRVAVRVALPPLCEASVAQYVQQRLQRVGGQSPLAGEAISQLTQLSGGIPRAINELAELSLLVGVADRVDDVTAADVLAAHRELRMPQAA